MTFPDLMDRMVIKRIGLARSAYSQPLDAKYHDNAARGHLTDGTMVKGRWHTYPEMAAAGLWTTPTDLSKFMIEIWKASRGESNRVIEKPMARQMLETQKGNYGLGVGVEGEGAARWFGHGGSNEGFKCNMQMYIESGDGIAIMTNGDSGSGLAREIQRAAAAVYGWPGQKPEIRKAAVLSNAQLERLAGTYKAENFEIHVAAEKGALALTSRINAGKAEFLPLSETEFFPTVDGLAKIKFVIGPDGKASVLEVFGDKMKRIR
jgi:CubicO group peptidase (beta-lactamase class C family)